MSVLSLNHVTKIYRGEVAPALHDVSFTVSEGERVAIVGESGSGKTTSLNIALGFDVPSSGDVQVADPQTTGLVFQNPAASLDPRWRVERIVSEGVPGVGEAEVRAALAAVSLDYDELSQRYISDISGGQAQRVAIARALVSEPTLLVADEPVSAVDVLGKKHIIESLRSVQEDRGLASLIVLHDLGVAQQLSERIIVMQAGRVVEDGATAEVLAHPQHRYTAQLIDAARW